MIIDCDGCQVRDLACDDCVVAVLLGPGGASAAASPAGTPRGPGVPVDLDDTERTAIGVLADSGLVPPLRLVRREAG